MTLIEIVPSTAAHALALAPMLRPGDAAEIRRCGWVPRRAVWHSFRRSVLRRTALVDGQVAAMWGCGGVLLGQTGEPWLLTSPHTERVSPLAFARIYRRESSEMLRWFPVLASWVDARYDEAVRLLELTGFDVGAAEPTGPNGAMFRPYRMER